MDKPSASLPRVQSGDAIVSALRTGRGRLHLQCGRETAGRNACAATTSGCVGRARVGKMMTNLIITALGVGSVLFLMKSDVRHGSAMLRRNVKTIRSWLEDEGATAAARSG